jgi:hypothetical protein
MSKIISWGMCLLFGLVLFGCSKATQDRASNPMGAAANAAAGELASVAGGPELLNKVVQFFNSATQSLQSITDVNSAKAAVPKLEELAKSADSLSQAIGTLPQGGKSAMSSVFENGIAGLKAHVEKIEALPGVSAVVKPAIDKLMEKLSPLAVKQE